MSENKDKKALKDLKEEWKASEKHVASFIDENLYKQKLDKEARRKKINKVLLETFKTRYLLNLHKTFEFYSKKKYSAVGEAAWYSRGEPIDHSIEEQLKLVDEIDSQHLQNEEDVMVKIAGDFLSDEEIDDILNQKRQDVVETVIKNSQLHDYNLISSANSLILTYILVPIFVLISLLGGHFILAMLASIIPFIAYSNHNYLYESIKRKALYDKNTDAKHRGKMYTIDLLRHFTTSITMLLLMGFITIFILPEYLGSFNIRGVLVGVSIVSSLAFSTWYTNFMRVKIDRKDKLDAKYTYVQADEVWLPENSIFASDVDVRHPIVGFVDGDTDIPYYLRFQNLDTHALIMGGTGSGKTALMILPLLVQFLSYENTGVIVIDPKGDLIVDMISIMDMFKLKDKKISRDFYAAKAIKLEQMHDEIEDMADGYRRDKLIYQYYELLKREPNVYIPASKNQMIFDPLDEVDCPYFNPLKGDLATAQKLFKAIILAGADENNFFDGQGELLLTNSINLLKLLESAQFVNDGIPQEIVSDIKKEFQGGSILTKHVNNYLSNTQKMQVYNKWAQVVVADRLKKNMSGAEDMDTSLAGMLEYAAKGSKTFENTSKIRADIAKIVNNKHLNFIYNPTTSERATRKELSFEEAILNKDIIGIATRQEILGQKYARVLGLSLILTLQEIIFSIPMEKRQYCQLFIDEFQVFANDDMGILFNQGRSYKVCMFAATQALDQIDTLTKGLKETVLANTFTKLLHSSLNAEDTKYFMGQAGESEEVSFEADKVRIDTTTGIQDNNAMLGKVINKKNNLEFDKMNYGQDQYGFAMSRYVLARRKPKFIRMAFLGDWVSDADMKLKKKLESKYVEDIEEKVKHYLVSNLEPITMSSTGIVELISRKETDSFDASEEF